jgi:hypothetical protein
MLAYVSDSTLGVFDAAVCLFSPRLSVRGPILAAGSRLPPNGTKLTGAERTARQRRRRGVRLSEGLDVDGLSIG